MPRPFGKRIQPPFEAKEFGFALACGSVGLCRVRLLREARHIGRLGMAEACGRDAECDGTNQIASTHGNTPFGVPADNSLWMTSEAYSLLMRCASDTSLKASQRAWGR